MKDTRPAPEFGIQPTTRRIAVAQLEALLEAVTVGTAAAAIAAISLVATLRHLGFAAGWKDLSWAAYIVACAVSHVLLRQLYTRLKPADSRWQPWAWGFTAICFAEGVGWGFAPIVLATGGRFDVELIVVLVMLAVSAGAIPVFGAYLPAFIAIFLPATVPFLIMSLLSTDAVRHDAYGLMLVFVVGIGGVGITASRSFKQLVGLRIRTEELATNLRRQKEIAEQANLAKSSFLAAASHDLRQPVHALGLFVGALRGVTMPPEGKRLLEQIETSIEAMDGLFGALLDISRLDAGVVEVCRRPFAIGPLLQRICADHAEEAKAKGISLVCKPNSAIVDSDVMLMERILRNLISNAVRYTERGGILVGCRRRGPLVMVQVWDTGVGIPSGQQERVFQEYYQLGNPERDRTKGLGLGLAIVRRLTDLLDCELRLRSRVGRGSCFDIMIPSARDAVGLPQAEPQADTGALARRFIVVIDDELAIRQAMSSLLTAWGHNLIAAGSGEEAIERLSVCPVRPDLIICDYRLRNGENGIDAIRRLRSDYNEAIPAMLITGDTAPDRLAEAQASGLLLVHKPISNVRLRAAITNLISAPKAAHMAEWPPSLK